MRLSAFIEKICFFQLVSCILGSTTISATLASFDDLVTSAPGIELVLRGDNLGRNDTVYNDAIEVAYLLPDWQQYRPPAVAVVDSPLQLSNVLTWAMESTFVEDLAINNTTTSSNANNAGLVSPVGGRHSGAGYAFAGRAAAIQFGSNLSAVGPLDETERTLYVGAGATLGDVAKYLNGTGYVTATGVCAGVGISGWTLGGGFSPFNKWMGLGADNTVSFDVVLANGTITTASETKHPELFWALRGAGHQSFAYVTGLTVRVMPLESFVFYRVSVPCEEDPEFCANAIDVWQQLYYEDPAWVESDLATYSWSLALNTTDDNGVIRLFFSFVYANDGLNAVQEMTQILEPLNKFLRVSKPEGFDPDEYQVMNLEQFLDVADSQGYNSYVAPSYEPKVGLYLKRDMDLQGWRQYVNAAISYKELESTVERSHGMYFVFEAYASGITGKSTNFNAHFQRDQVLGVAYFDLFTPTEMRANDTQTPQEAWDAGMEWLVSLYQPNEVTGEPPKLEGLLYEHDGRFQAYVNYRQSRFGEGPDRWTALETYYGGNLCRLVEIKRAYDPYLVFDFPQGIPLEAPSGKCSNVAPWSIENNGGGADHLPSNSRSTSISRSGRRLRKNTR